MSKLKKLRLASGMTQKELAKESGVSFSAISKIEQGDRNIGGISAENLYKLASALGVKMEDLLTIEEENDMLSKKEISKAIRERNRINKLDGFTATLMADISTGEVFVDETYGNTTSSYNNPDIVDIEGYLEAMRLEITTDNVIKAIEKVRDIGTSDNSLYELMNEYR